MYLCKKIKKYIILSNCTEPDTIGLGVVPYYNIWSSVLFIDTKPIICPIEHIEKVVFFILALAIRVAEHETETCLVDTVAVLLQANLSIVIKCLLRIIIETGRVAERTIRRIKIKKCIALSIVEGGFEVTCQNLHMFK